MAIVIAEIQNFAGIHVRPSGVIIKEAEKYSGKITVKAKDMSIDLNNIMGLIALGLAKGDTVEIEVTGPDEDVYVETLKNLFEQNFDFPPRS